MSNETISAALGEKVAHLAKHDPQFRAAMPDEDVLHALAKPGLLGEQVFSILFDRYAPREALGERAYRVSVDGEGRHERELLPRFNTITYAELGRRVQALASTWRHHDQHRVGVEDFVAILGFTGLDFAVVDVATTFAQAVTVPLQTSLPEAELSQLTADLTPKAIFSTAEYIELAAQLAIANGGTRSVVVFDYNEEIDSERERFEAARAAIEESGAKIQFATLDELIDFGSQLEWQPLPPHEKGLDRVAAIIHSSGSTGVPKGVLCTEHMTNHVMVVGTGAAAAPPPNLTVALAPMHHFMGRGQVFGALAKGGTAFYTSSADLTTLFEDFQIVRPTVLSLFPRVMELIYQHFKSAVARGVEQGLGDQSEVDAQVRKTMRDSFLGDRLLVVSGGSAPTPPEVIQFVTECFGVPFVEGYGSTESGGSTAVDGIVTRPPIIDYKLRDVPELGYYTTDKPYPRGELLVKSATQSPGFYNKPEATAELFDEDGYVITGDIMEERGPDRLAVIDRRKDVLKLSQAEFVAPGRLGAQFEGGCPSIDQIYVYGNSTRSYLLAVVVPDVAIVESKLGATPGDAEVKSLIRSELQEFARDAGLKSFEVPRDFIIETEQFSTDNGLLTGVRKYRRPNLMKKYGDRLEQIYAETESRREEELQALKDPDSPLTTLEKVTKVLEATLGVEHIDPQSELNFTELGGDSLASVSLGLHLEEIFGVSIPVNAVVNPAANPATWAEAVDMALQGGDQPVVRFQDLHGEGATALHGKELDINRFLDDATIGNIPSAPPREETRTVLLTGASGFLGKILCLEWMKQIAPLGGKVICLVRATSADAARSRLDAAFADHDPELEKIYQELSADHLEVLAADLGEYRSGLSAQIWERLAEEVDHIVHSGALVNHVLGYEHLFGPNVYGTAELVRLALTTRQKRFDFLSTLGVASVLENDPDGSDVINDEDSPLLESIPIMSAADQYAYAYVATKWACEHLLHDAHEKYGLPVNIFRPSMIMPHSEYTGQINIPDMFTRMLYSLVMTGLAPESFYEAGPDGERAHAHYDGFPGDFVAKAIMGIGARPSPGVHTYNVTNHHLDDGVSLDSVVDWIQSAGYTLRRESDHAAWYDEMVERLNALTEAQRRHSSVDILEQFAQPAPARIPTSGSERFQAAVGDLPDCPEIPHITEEFIHKYLDDMRVIGLIPDPDGVIQ